MTIVFDDEQLQVIFQPAEDSQFRDLLIVTFNGIGSKAGKSEFWAKSFLTKANIAGLGFVSKKQNWFPQKSVKAAALACRPILDRYDIRLLYGYSMGAYAALKYYFELSASRAIAFCSQFSIEPAVIGEFDPRFKKYFDPAMHTNMEIVDLPGAVGVYIFYDPFDVVDKINAELIGKVMPSASLIRVPFTGHGTITAFTRTSVATSLIKSVINNKASDVQIEATRARRSNPGRFYCLVRTAIKRDIMLAVNLLRGSDPRLTREFKLKLLDGAIAALLNQGGLDSALELVDIGLEMQPGSSLFMRRKSDIYLRRHELTAAMDWAATASTVGPKDAYAHAQVAKVALAQDDLASAERALRLAHALNPSDGAIQRQMIDVWLRLERFEDALALAQSAVAHNPEVAWPHHTLAGVFFARGLMEQAASAEASAIRIDPRNTSHLRRMSAISMRKGDFVRAQEWASRAIEVDPHDVSAHCLVADALLKRCDVLGAEAALRAVLQIKPDDETARKKLALLVSRAKAERAES